MTAAGGKTPILVVDDETPRVLRTSLAMEGYHVLEAGNGAGAIAMIGREKPEVVILDLGLPDIDGLDVIRRIRAGGSKVPIIVLSSRGDERAKVEAFDLGADDYVTKPIGMARTHRPHPSRDTASGSGAGRRTAVQERHLNR